MAKLLAKMMRSVKNQLEAMIIGATGSATNGALQFYSILNNLPPSGTNRGSIAFTLPTTGSNKPLHHIDAINVTLGELPISSPEDAQLFTPVVNWKTFIKLMRVTDTTNQYFYDYETKTFKSLLTGGSVRVVANTSLPDDVVGIWDLSNVQLKMLRGFEIKTRISSLANNKLEIYIDTYADAGLSMAYKATPTKNGFRHITLKADYSV
jgi:hypothetical protein